MSYHAQKELSKQRDGEIFLIKSSDGVALKHTLVFVFGSDRIGFLYKKINMTFRFIQILPIFLVP